MPVSSQRARGVCRSWRHRHQPRSLPAARPVSRRARGSTARCSSMSRPPTAWCAGWRTPASRCSAGFRTAPTRPAPTASCRRGSRRPGWGRATRSSYGPISPQTPSGYRSDYAQLIAWDRHVGIGGMSEDCLIAQRLDARRQGQRQARRAGVVSRRRLGDRLRQRPDVRRRPAGAARRRGRRHREPPARKLRLHASALDRCTGGVQARRRVRRDGHGRVARVGARQHRVVWRRPVARDDLRPVRRRLEDVDAARDARGQGPVPSRRRAERLDAADRRRGRRREGRGPVRQEARPDAQPHRRHPAPAVGAAAGSAGRDQSADSRR